MMSHMIVHQLHLLPCKMLQAVSVGRDGGIYLLDPIHGQIGHAVKQPRPTASYYAVKWVSNTMLVTTGTTGAAELQLSFFEFRAELLPQKSSARTK